MYQVTFEIEGFTSFVSIFLFRVSTEIDTNFQSDENPSKRKLEIMLTEKIRRFWKENNERWI